MTASRLRQTTRNLRRAYADTAAARDQAQVLLSVAEAVNSSLSLEDVIDVALSRSVRLVEASAGAFYMVRTGSVELVREAAMGLAANAAGDQRDTAEEPIKAALVTEAPSVHALPAPIAPGLGAGGRPSHVLVVPIRRGGTLMGAMEIYLDGPRVLPQHMIELLEGIAAQAATAIRHAQLFREQEESSLTDELTRLPNRRYLGQRFLQERQRARRGQRPLGVLMLDIDHFKQINDTYGHLVGDAVLAQLAAVLRRSTREADTAARYGGDEFAVIVYETPLEGALRLAARVRAAVEGVVFPHQLRLTVSIGVALTDDPERFGQLFAAADAALYQAKRQGRNQVCSAAEVPLGSEPPQSRRRPAPSEPETEPVQ